MPKQWPGLTNDQQTQANSTELARTQAYNADAAHNLQASPTAL